MHALVLKMSSTAESTSVMQVSNIFWQDGSVETVGGEEALGIADATAREASKREDRTTGRVLKSIMRLNRWSSETLSGF